MTVPVILIVIASLNAAVYYSCELWCPTHRVTQFTTLFSCSKYTFKIQGPIISCSSKHLLKTDQHKYRHSSSSYENISFLFNCFALKTVIRLLKVPSVLHDTSRLRHGELSWREQVGNLSAHALEFTRFKRKRLGASKYSNAFLVSFFQLTKKLLIYCIIGKARKYENVLRLEKCIKLQLLRNLIHRNCLQFQWKCPIIPTILYF
jgi:hypothetical protein